MADRFPIIVSAAWPPAVGGVASFSTRLANDKRLQQRFSLVRHSVLKRPSIFVESDRPALSSLQAPIWKFLSGIANIGRFVFLLARHRPRVVHVQYNGAFRGFLLLEICLYLAMARLSGAGAVVRHSSHHHPHVSENGRFWGWIVERVYSRLLGGYLLQSRRLVEEYRSWLAGLGVSASLAYVPNTIDTKKFSPRSVPGPGAPEKPIRIGCIAGPETGRKGARYLVRALESLAGRPSYASFELDAIAVTPEFEDEVSGSPIVGRLRKRPFLGYDEKVEWFQALDIFVLPSLDEGFPNVILESMACGVATVATSVGVVDEVIEPGIDGMIVPPRGVEELAGVLDRLLTDEGLRERIASNGRRSAVEKFAVDGNWIRAVIELYESVAGA